MGAKERFEQRIETYFQACDATRQQVQLKSGMMAERQLPYTLYGLCAAVGLHPERALALAAGGEGQLWQRRLLENALCRIAAFTMERALMGELTHQVALAAIRELGFMPEASAESAGALSVTMDAMAEECGR